LFNSLFNSFCSTVSIDGSQTKVLFSTNKVQIMMKVLLFATIAFTTFQGVLAQSGCGDGGLIQAVGSTTVEIITKVTGPEFLRYCPGNTFSVAGGGTSAGAQGVCCANSNGSADVTVCTDIGNMSTDWAPAQATIVAGEAQTLKCAQG
jgi:ABC-type phosphate transport system substrate-binding protein